MPLPVVSRSRGCPYQHSLQCCYWVVFADLGRTEDKQRKFKVKPSKVVPNSAKKLRRSTQCLKIGLPNGVNMVFEGHGSEGHDVRPEELY